MKTVDPKDLTADERIGLVRALIDTTSAPVRGVHYGPGPHCAMPASITESDIASGDMARWIGWTHAGPNTPYVWEVPAAELDALDTDPLVKAKVRDEKTLKDAEKALKKFTTKLLVAAIATLEVSRT